MAPQGGLNPRFYSTFRVCAWEAPLVTNHGNDWDVVGAMPIGAEALNSCGAGRVRKVNDELKATG
jgi:hypothetical protein